MSQRGTADRRRRVIRAVAAVAVLACLAGCGSGAYRPAAAGGPDAKRAANTHDARAASAPGVPIAGTAAEADAEARHLLAEVVLPGGARRLPQRPVPGAVSQPGQDLGAGIDLYHVFGLPMSMDAAQQFVRAHLPAGLTSTGTGWGSDGGMPEYDELAADVAPGAIPPGIDVAQLVFTIAPDAGGGSLLRADAQIIIFPARSAAEYLDPGDIRSVTVSTTGQDPVSRTITSRPEIARLTRVLDGEDAFPLGLVYPCPIEPGAGYQLTFTPVSASRPTVVVDPANCMGDAVFANGVRQPGLVDAGLFSITQRLLPQPQRALPG
jgi:predicted small lipoprotein YifL